MPKATRGEIWAVEFDPAVGAEIRKVRPAVVMNAGMWADSLCIVVPLTDWKPIFADCIWFTEIAPTLENGLTKLSGADAFQVKSFSENRLKQRLGRLADAEVTSIAAAIALCVGHR